MFNCLLRRLLPAFLSAVIISLSLAGCSRPSDTHVDTGAAVAGADGYVPSGPEVVEALSYFDRSAVPDFSGSPYFIINNNVPFFDEAELVTESFEYYSPLDALGRCGPCIACVGRDIMPTEPRGEIGMVKPTGWHTAKYNDLVDGNYLYNRCHLLGFQLTGENANEKNLITGTRYLNVEGMLPFEKKVVDYVTRTGNHVLYRVTPIFDADNLLADGVLMEAESVEDKGEGVLFCVFCYNAQPGIIIDYATGDSRLDENADAAEGAAAADESEAASDGETGKKQTYVLNTNTHKFHYSDCESVKDIKPKNKKVVETTREELINQGYDSCGRCRP